MFTLPDETPEAALERVNNRARRYELGQFFTPDAVAKFMAEAAMVGQPDRVLDPAIGGGVLLRHVGPGVRRFGLDIDPPAVELSRASLEAQGGTNEITAGDFLDREKWPLSEVEFEAVISNPPYIRHHNLSADEKARAGYYSGLFGCRVSPLAGSYVYFLLEAIARLTPGGRLVFITPTEVLDVKYGSAVKQILMEHMRIDEILVLDQDALAFAGVLTTSAITIATKRPTTSSIRLTAASMNGTVTPVESTVLSAEVARPELPWTMLLPSRAARVLALSESRTATLGEYARVRRGTATGDNSFFCLTDDAVKEWGIESEYLVPAVLGSKDLPETGALTQERWDARRKAGARCWLLWCHVGLAQLAGTNVARYIAHGEELGVHARFNCRTRSPWYSVERVAPGDFFVTYMSRDRSRFVRNLAGARCMTSLLNVWAKEGVSADALESELLDEATPQLLREYGRTYGGGLGKIEPSELLRLPIHPPVGAAASDEQLEAGLVP